MLSNINMANSLQLSPISETTMKICFMGNLSNLT